jgi:hypothetical protein
MGVVLLVSTGWADGGEALGFKSLFNGKDLSGWIDVNTSKDTWSVKDGILVCSGHPIGVMRSAKQYENFILEIEWRHMEAGGNSGVFVWSEGTPFKDTRLARGVEVQMLELDWAVQHKATDAYVHGELFGTMGLKVVWNKYVVVCIDGVIKLSVNGKFVNGISHAEVKKGYLCLESEGAEIHFRKIRIMELPPGITSEMQAAPVVKDKKKSAAKSDVDHKKNSKSSNAQ